MTVRLQGGSASITRPTYWWYVARGRFLRLVLQPYVTKAERVLDVGSADGPSAAWLPGRIALDIDPRGLRNGDVCASADTMPFADETFDVVSAFDVIEHFPADRTILLELWRVLKPGGVLLIAVPAYQWAWSAFDVRSGHYRRYTRHSLSAAVTAAGFSVQHTTYAFLLTLPFFVAARLMVKLGRSSGEISELPGPLERLLLRLCRIEERLLRRSTLPAGSSVFLAATK